MRFVPWNVGATITWDLDRVPDDGGTFTVYDIRGGAAQPAQAAVLDSTATTVGATAPAGSRTLTLAATAGLVAGRKYLLGGPEEAGGEFVVVTKVTSGTTVALARGIRMARTTGDTFQSTRVKFVIGAAAAVNPGRNFRVTWAWTSGTIPQSLDLPFDVTRYTPVTGCTVESVRTLDALAAKRIPDGTWMPDVMANAWVMLLRRVAGKVAPGAVVGTVDLTIPHAYLTLVLLLEPGAEDQGTQAILDRLEKRFHQELDAAMSALSVDENADGDAKTGEPGWSTRGISFIRS